MGRFDSFNLNVILRIPVISVGIIDADVEVRSCGTARGACESDSFAPFYVLTFGNKGFVKVCICNDKALRGLQAQEIPVIDVVSRFCYLAVGRCGGFRVLRYGDVQPVMVGAFAGNGVGAVPEP